MAKLEWVPKNNIFIDQVDDLCHQHESNAMPVGFGEVSEEVVNGQEILEATEALKKWLDLARNVKMLELKKHSYKAMVDRYTIVGSETGNSKVLCASKSLHPPCFLRYRFLHSSS